MPVSFFGVDDFPKLSSFFSNTIRVLVAFLERGVYFDPVPGCYVSSHLVYYGRVKLDIITVDKCSLTSLPGPFPPVLFNIMVGPSFPRDTYEL